MLPRLNRLHARRDVDRVSRAGRPVFAPNLTIRFVTNRMKRPRATVVAGLKVSKRSTERNRAKRLIREALRRNLTAICPDVDFTVYVKASIVGRGLQEVSRELGGALARGGLLRGPWVDNNVRAD